MAVIVRVIRRSPSMPRSSSATVEFLSDFPPEHLAEVQIGSVSAFCGLPVATGLDLVQGEDSRQRVVDRIPWGVFLAWRWSGYRCY